jgi:hypothetical protein
VPRNHRISRIVVLFALAFQLLACFGETPDMADKSRILALVERMQSDEVQTRIAAEEQLEALSTSGLSEDEAITALEAAASEFPPLEYEWQSAASSLIRAAATSPTESLVPVVRSHYRDYPLSAKTDALLLLSRIRSDSSAELFVELAIEEARNPDGLSFLPSVGFTESPRDANILFPGLFQAMNQPELAWGVAELALKYFEVGEIDRGTVDAHYSHIHNLLTELLQKAKSIDDDEKGDWLWEEDYQDIRGIAGLLLDLSGYFEVEEARLNLQTALQLADPRLKFFAAQSLMSLGHDVPDSALYDIAESHEVRNWLFNYMQASNQIDRFPQEFLSQEAFAQSEMVNWLTYPTELGREPHEIAVVQSVNDEEYVYYVLKFRTGAPHWSAESGWMLGVAGPFIIDDMPSTTSYGYTFSTFAKLDDTDVDEYVGEIRSLLGEWREQDN